MNGTTAIINGRLVDPTRGTEDVTNLVLNSDGVITGMGYIPDDDQETTTVIDLKGQYIIPNITDSYCSLREPGHEDKETFLSASAAAVAGGVSVLVATPDTHPTVDTPEMVSFIHARRRAAGVVPIYPLGAVSKGIQGTELAELRLMHDAGAVGFTDGNSLEHTGLMRHALQYSSDLDRPIIVTPDDPLLSQNGVMNEGYYSTILGLRGIPAESEELRIARDIELVERFGGVIHFFPISTAQSVELVRRAKARGLAITCGTAPHYLYFDESNIDGYPTNFKVTPPLRSAADRAALIDGIKDGTIDTIASHHQPHTVDGKRTDFVSADPGISGIDTLVCTTLTRLVKQEGLPMATAVKLLSTNPLSIYRIKRAGTALLKRPSFTVVDMKTEFT
ncbi:dihydroorotase, partial [bacterium]|nr:dihydroorotase [bacterium]